jgi:hypothetical protein
MHASASGSSFDETAGSGRSYGCCGRLTRARWSVWEVAAIVAGFAIYWPLGLLALFLKWKIGEVWPGASESRTPWSGFKMPRFGDFGSWTQRGSTGFGAGSSGNAAFDDYRRDTLQRLEKERRKLDEEGRAFREFVEKLRRAKDQEEFDRFMAERRQRPGADPAN